MKSLERITYLIERDIDVIYEGLSPGMMMSGEACKRVQDYAKILLAIDKDRPEETVDDLGLLTIDELKTLAAQAIQTLGLHKETADESDV